MTNLEEFRKRIGDNVRDSEVIHDGDGETRVWNVGKVGLSDVKVWVNGALQTLTTHYSVDEVVGNIIFVTAPASGNQITVQFKFSAFTDTEANDMIDSYGLFGALTMACEILMMDAAKMNSYKFGDTQVDSKDIFEKLKTMKKIFEDNDIQIPRFAKLTYPDILDGGYPEFATETTEVIDLTRD